MARRLGLASLFVVVCAFAGPTAGPSGTLPARQLIVSIACLSSTETSDHQAPHAAPAAAPLPRPDSSRRGGLAPRPAVRPRHAASHSLFQRPPPLLL